MSTSFTQDDVSLISVFQQSSATKASNSRLVTEGGSRNDPNAYRSPTGFKKGRRGKKKRDRSKTLMRNRTVSYEGSELSLGQFDSVESGTSSIGRKDATHIAEGQAFTLKEKIIRFIQMLCFPELINAGFYTSLQSNVMENWLTMRFKNLWEVAYMTWVSTRVRRMYLYLALLLSLFVVPVGTALEFYLGVNSSELWGWILLCRGALMMSIVFFVIYSLSNRYSGATPPTVLSVVLGICLLSAFLEHQCVSVRSTAGADSLFRNGALFMWIGLVVSIHWRMQVVFTVFTFSIVLALGVLDTCPLSSNWAYVQNGVNVILGFSTAAYASYRLEFTRRKLFLLQLSELRFVEENQEALINFPRPFPAMAFTRTLKFYSERLEEAYARFSTEFKLPYLLKVQWILLLSYTVIGPLQDLLLFNTSLSDGSGAGNTLIVVWIRLGGLPLLIALTSIAHLQSAKAHHQLVSGSIIIVYLGLYTGMAWAARLSDHFFAGVVYDIAAYRIVLFGYLSAEIHPIWSNLIGILSTVVYYGMYFVIPGWSGEIPIHVGYPTMILCGAAVSFLQERNTRTAFYSYNSFKTRGGELVAHVFTPSNQNNQGQLREEDVILTTSTAISEATSTHGRPWNSIDDAIPPRPGMNTSRPPSSPLAKTG